MGKTSEPHADALSVEEMQVWLKEEVRDSAKAFELRSKEATELVTAYARGELTTDQAMDRFAKYDQRWGEALPGTSAFPGLSDQDILKNIDAAQEPDSVATNRLLKQYDAAGKRGR